MFEPTVASSDFISVISLPFSQFFMITSPLWHVGPTSTNPLKRQALLVLERTKHVRQLKASTRSNEDSSSTPLLHEDMTRVLKRCLFSHAALCLCEHTMYGSGRKGKLRDSWQILYLVKWSGLPWPGKWLNSFICNMSQYGELVAVVVKGSTRN